jgi:hypothetical protein
MLMGDTLEVATDMDTYTIREPLGVVAGITPFNFPAMIPLWMFPLANVIGNTCIIKPSEKDPGATMILAELAQKAGIPAGVLNVVHGARDTVNFICDNEHIKAISFVGSDQAGHYIHDRGSRNGKRVQVTFVFALFTCAHFPQASCVCTDPWSLKSILNYPFSFFSPAFNRLTWAPRTTESSCPMLTRTTP